MTFRFRVMPIRYNISINPLDRWKYPFKGSSHRDLDPHNLSMLITRFHLPSPFKEAIRQKLSTQGSKTDITLINIPVNLSMSMNSSIQGIHHTVRLLLPFQ